MKYDVCPLCGDVVFYEDGVTSPLYQIIRSGRAKRVYHTKCVDKERGKQNEHIKSKEIK